MHTASSYSEEASCDGGLSFLPKKLTFVSKNKPVYSSIVESRFPYAS